jgi:hypothetical protein
MKTTAKTTGEMIPQPHGGALRRGGTNKGGPGRPPSWFRELARAKLERHVLLEELAKMARSPEVEPRDRIRAIEALLRYGVGTREEVTGPDGKDFPPCVVLLPPLDDA